MRTDEPRPIRLSDYRPPDFTIEEVALEVALDADLTRVKAKSRVRRLGAPDAPLSLHGENLELVSVKIDRKRVGKRRLTLKPDGLVIADAPNTFTLEIETTFSPRENTALSGIYLSGDRIFSQCEAEGFRRITYFLDRPDVLARYSVRIEGDKTAFPTLLSNGNLVRAGDLEDGRHFAEWRDPFPKPSYLFALVAGGFDLLEDEFVTRSGKVTPLRIYVDPGDAPRATYAMDALKRAMLWDEETFDREYDLDLFMIVAVRDFNFGAMENKGLNIFNSSVLLADEDTATDIDYEAIESIVAHEYFHNWTGNRITCRDWFQLCLKEGLTVFRDQAFSADERGEAVSRIKDVRRLRARQFPEDAGPLAHPVRPSQYLTIDNFYTATVYEKGAELIHMLREIIGPEAFRAGMDRYFADFDGQAATMEDFLSCFAADLGPRAFPFLRWYEQPGAPRVSITSRHDPESGVLSVTAEQSPAPTAGEKAQPLPIPVRFAALASDGERLPLRYDGETRRDVPDERVLLLDTPVRTWRFVGFHGEPPTLSVLRGFSAPVIASLSEPAAHVVRRAACDDDAFNRWEAGQSVLREELVRLTGAARAGAPLAVADDALDVLSAAAKDESLDPALAALALSVPDAHEIAMSLAEVDPDAIQSARETLMAEAARRLQPALEAIRRRLPLETAFAPDAAGAGRRALRNVALRFLAALGPETGGAAAREQLDAANNLTDRLAALAALDVSGSPAFDDALATLYAAWKDQPLLVDKWFAAQAGASRKDAPDRVRALLDHEAYDERTPNRVRAVLGVFALRNLTGFHAADGRGYTLFIERVIALDKTNPAIAARLLGALEIWPRLEPKRRKLAREALVQARDAAGASRNLYEIATKSLEAAGV